MDSCHGSSIRIALLTPPGRGALAVVGVSGQGAVDLVGRLFAARSGRPLAEQSDGSIAFGRWGNPERGEEVVVVRHVADRLEVHCHGGLAASKAILSNLEALGAIPAAGCHLPPIRRASRQSAESSASAVSRRLSIQGEAIAALARTGGSQAARILCRQLSGILADELDRIEALHRAGDLGTANSAINRLLRAARVGLRIVKPWRVALSGPVNAGKSSLVNALAGYHRSIVSAEPNTTRDVVTTRLVLDGWEIDLIDTAGLPEWSAAASATERAGFQRAFAAAASADLVICVTEMRPAMASMLMPIDRQEKSQAPCGRSMFPKCIDVVSKCDLAAGVDAPPEAIRTSALTGDGIDSLARAIVATLVPKEEIGPSILGGPMPFTSRQVAELYHM